jgi:hypothetical protein
VRSVCRSLLQSELPVPGATTTRGSAGAWVAVRVRWVRGDHHDTCINGAALTVNLAQGGSQTFEYLSCRVCYPRRSHCTPRRSHLTG